MDPVPALVVLGGSMMAAWAVVAYMYPRTRLMCAMFASAPAFQLVWIGLFPGKRPITLVPALAVPLVTITVAMVVTVRRARSAREPRP